MASVVVHRRAPDVAQVTMNRAAVFNAFDEAMIGELDAAFAELSVAPDVRVIVLAGEGKHFSAGADLQWMQRASEASFEWNLADARRFAAMLARIEACPKHCIAMGDDVNPMTGLVPVALDLEACNGCGLCFAACPEPYGLMPAPAGARSTASATGAFDQPDAAIPLPAVEPLVVKGTYASAIGALLAGAGTSSAIPSRPPRRVRS